MYVPFFFVQLYAIQEGIMSENLAFYLLPVLNAGSIFGRIIPNFLADKIGPLNVLIPCSLIAALLAFCWIAIKNTAGLIIFCLLYGFFSGSFVSLPAMTVVSLSPNLGVVGVRMGMNFAFGAFGILVGNPIAGSIYKSKGWIGMQAFAGSWIIASGFFVIAARIAKVRLKVMSKA
jgi:MFS family permease